MQNPKDCTTAPANRRYLCASLFWILAMMSACIGVGGGVGGGSPPTRSAYAQGAAVVDVTSGRTVLLNQLAGVKGTVIFFTGIRCPIVAAYEPFVSELAGTLGPRGVTWVNVNSNYFESVDDLRQHAQPNAQPKALPLPLYKDVDGALADMFGATRTAEVVLLDGVRLHSGDEKS